MLPLYVYNVSYMWRTRKIFMGGIKCYLHGLHITWRSCIWMKCRQGLSRCRMMGRRSVPILEADCRLCANFFQEEIQKNDLKIFRRKSKQDLRCRMMGRRCVPILESDCRLRANWDWVASQDLDFNIPNWKIRLWYNFYKIVELPLFKNYTFNSSAIFAINLERLWQCASMIYHQSVQRNALLLHFKPQFQPKQGPTPCAKLAPISDMKYSGTMGLSYKRKT